MYKNETSCADVFTQNYTVAANDSDENVELPALPRGTVLSLSIVFAAGVFLSAVSNVVVACVIILGNHKSRSFNVFLFNLTISDWTLSTICLPFLFESTLTVEWKFGKVMCTAVPLILKVSQIASVFSLMAIWIDRNRAVMHPWVSEISTLKKVCAVLLIWSLAFLIACPKLKFMKTVDLPVNGELLHFCTEVWPAAESLDFKLIYIWALFIVTYVVPMVTLFGCYLRMGMKLLRDEIPGLADERRNTLQRRAKRKAFRTLVSVIILFAVCWLPSNLYNLVLISYKSSFFKTRQQLTMTLRACLFIWIVLSDAVINPFVYMFLSDRFAREVERLRITCLRLGRRESDDVSGASYTRRRSRSGTLSVRSLTTTSGRSNGATLVYTRREQNGLTNSQGHR
ncbi:prolactin-releasing peptide receptor-like [Ptychodera flava]|uniref:prolactin-releasing peptide receptor-like n=1 Tax=Ptychodera flava TaxID=63121 RepID=UPI003969E005